MLGASGPNEIPLYEDRALYPSHTIAYLRAVHRLFLRGVKEHSESRVMVTEFSMFFISSPFLTQNEGSRLFQWHYPRFKNTSFCLFQNVSTLLDFYVVTNCIWNTNPYINERIKKKNDHTWAYIPLYRKLRPIVNCGHTTPPPPKPNCWVKKKLSSLSQPIFPKTIRCNFPGDPLGPSWRVLQRSSTTISRKRPSNTQVTRCELPR